MTGFARVRRSVPEGELTVTMKSVNHRGLDLHFHLPGDLDPYEGAIRAAVKARTARGHVQITIGLARSGADGAGSLNREMLAAYLRAFHQAQGDFGLSGMPDLNTALGIPGMFRGDCSPDDLGPEFEPALLGAVEEACTLLNSFREREGAAIAAEMLARSAAVTERAEAMEQIRTTATGAFQKRLRQRLDELLNGVAVESHRLAQEAAILADRSDISEELIRLRTHAAQLASLLRSSGEVGKKLDFLLQEMNRETNTILAKTGGVGDIGLTLTALALDAKAEIDKIREQSLNLE